MHARCRLLLPVGSLTKSIRPSSLCFLGLYAIYDGLKSGNLAIIGVRSNKHVPACSCNKPFQGCSFRYRLTGYFYPKPITTLENISYIFLAQAELKTQVYMENYNLLQHNKLAL